MVTIEGVELTERPGVLLARTVFKEESSRTLKYNISLEGSDSFELWGKRIEDARIVRGALGDILRVHHSQLVDFLVRCTRKECVLGICFQLILCPILKVLNITQYWEN